MADLKIKLNRNYGYDILINTFEPFLRMFLCDEIFVKHHGSEWLKQIPQGVLTDLSIEKGIIEFNQLSIKDFFEELTFLNLKDIAVFSNNYQHSKHFLGNLSKDKFIEIMDKLNVYRRKIAHSNSYFTNLDLENIIELVKLLCQGDAAKEIIIYLENEEYKNAKEIPLEFYESFDCQHNLPPENYDLDGGFVGRDEEIKTIRKLLLSDQDRIITITGAGGVGKTAIALKLSYMFLADPQNPFEAIIWFSAKSSKLTDEGIVPLEPGIKDSEQLITDLLKIVDLKTLETFKTAEVPLTSYKTHLYTIFASQKCLIIIDNLETIIMDDALISFIKDIPRPSEVLITSRKGMGEIERRYSIGDMPPREAIHLFRIIAKERKRGDLLRLSEEKIATLVKQVKCYPLLIKWSIGQVCLGKDIESAFGEIFAGESEIAKFSFNDVFNLLSENAKTILYGMILYGDKPCSRFILMHLANLSDDQFEDSIKELIMTSFVFPETKEVEKLVVTEFSMLTLTRGFIEAKFDEDEKTKEMLLTRYHHLSEQVKDLEKSKTSYSQSIFSLGIKTIEEQVAFNYIKTGKIFWKQGYLDFLTKPLTMSAVGCGGAGPTP